MMRNARAQGKKLCAPKYFPIHYIEKESTMDLGLKEELVKIVGSKYVFDDPETLESYSRDYSLTPPRRPNYVVQPKNTEEIQKIVKLANKYSMPIVPSSSSVHFHGATIPSQAGIVVDLKRMDRILEIDERNRMARIEPGVTWGQLQAELETHGLMALNPLLPHASKSVLTSHLERDPMLIPKFEYGDPVLTMEVVLPTGSIFRTGSASAPGAPDDTIADLVGPYGPGLDFFRLFQGAQGTLGIVTWISIKVEYLPRLEKLFFIPFERIEDVIEPLYKIQRLMLGNECFVLNSFNLLTILAKKWPDEFKTLREVLPSWMLILCLAGTHRRPEERIAYEEEALMEIGSELHMDILPMLPSVPRSKKIILERLRKPWPRGETYWKFRYKGFCQDIFFHTTLNRVPEFTKYVYELAAKYQYPAEDIGCYIQPLERGRACYCEYSFHFDLNDLKDVERIRSLVNETSERLHVEGSLFTRPYGSWSNMVYDKATTYAMTLKEIKKIFDPNDIMNPGKLCF